MSGWNCEDRKKRCGLRSRNTRNVSRPSDFTHSARPLRLIFSATMRCANLAPLFYLMTFNDGGDATGSGAEGALSKYFATGMS